jgi:hypothetical protein
MLPRAARHEQCLSLVADSCRSRALAGERRWASSVVVINPGQRPTTDNTHLCRRRHASSQSHVETQNDRDSSFESLLLLDDRTRHKLRMKTNAFDGVFNQMRTIAADLITRSSPTEIKAKQVMKSLNVTGKGGKKALKTLQAVYPEQPFQVVEDDMAALERFRQEQGELTVEARSVLKKLRILDDTLDVPVADKLAALKAKMQQPESTAPSSPEVMIQKTPSGPFVRKLARHFPESTTTSGLSRDAAMRRHTDKNSVSHKLAVDSHASELATQPTPEVTTPKHTSSTPEAVILSPTRDTSEPENQTLDKEQTKPIQSVPKASKSPVAKSTKPAAAPQKLSSEIIQKTRVAVLSGDDVRKVQAKTHVLTALPIKTSAIPELRHDLSRVLFNPGVYELQDPRSRVWNFDPYLGSLMPPSEFNYEALNRYVTSSEDVVLRDVALEHNKRYIGSTSSMSGVLIHLHFLISNFRPLNLDMLSRGFADSGSTFTKIQRAPSAIFLRYKEGVYAVDADKELDTPNILMSLGRSMEKLLTSEKEEFERYRKSPSDTDTSTVVDNQPEAYHYSTLGQFLLRSQLDAKDARLPGSGVFDLKTRAVTAVRMMMGDHERGIGYEIRERLGTWESYEREYYDMLRSTFLKYSLQVRMGRMDGIFVAYHNTQRMFGFQYVPLPDMDLALHGQSDINLGDQEFSMSMQMLNHIFNEATMKYPAQSLRFHFEAREATEASPQCLNVFAEPITEEQIARMQESGKQAFRDYESRLHDPEKVTKSIEAEVSGVPDSPSVSSKFGSAAVSFIRSISGLDLSSAMATKSPEEPEEAAPTNAAPEAEKETQDAQASEGIDKPVIAWKIHVRNTVNTKPVVRPEKLKPTETWELQYHLEPLEERTARRAYLQCRNRRKSALTAPQDVDYAANFYTRNLINMSMSGEQWRQQQDALDAMRERVVLYED